MLFATNDLYLGLSLTCSKVYWKELERRWEDPEPTTSSITNLFYHLRLCLFQRNISFICEVELIFLGKKMNIRVTNNHN